MTFNDARTFPVPFGKYKGKQLQEVGQSDSGLLYLDWMLGLDNLYDKTKDALSAYLLEPEIEKRVRAAMDRKEERRSERVSGEGKPEPVMRRPPPQRRETFDYEGY